MKRLGILLISLSVIACQNEKKSNEQADTAVHASAATELSYKYDSLKVFSKNIVSLEKGIKDTTKAVIFYPVFNDQQVNQFITQKVLKAAGNDVHARSYQELATDFVKNFDDFKAEEKTYNQSWILDSKTEVLQQKKDYLSLLHTIVTYEGGAHPNSAAVYWNYQPETHQEITLESLLKTGGLPQLYLIGEKIFRKNEGLSPTASLKDHYFFEKDTFSLNRNFTITKEGLKFLYNPYEIKAYAYGTTELLIPFNELKDIARPNSLLSTSK